MATWGAVPSRASIVAHVDRNAWKSTTAPASSSTAAGWTFRNARLYASAATRDDA